MIIYTIIRKIVKREIIKKLTPKKLSFFLLDLGEMDGEFNKSIDHIEEWHRAYILSPEFQILSREEKLNVFEEKKTLLKNINTLMWFIEFYGIDN